MLSRRKLGHDKWILLLILGTGPALLTGCDDSVEPVPDAEPVRNALAALYEATSGNAWRNRDNWLTDAPLGFWYGVEVDQSGRVIGLDLASRNGLNGSIPAELANLSELEYLLLEGQQIVGRDSSPTRRTQCSRYPGPAPTTDYRVRFRPNSATSPASASLTCTRTD